MSVMESISQELGLNINAIKWSTTLRTKSDCRVAPISSDSLMHSHMGELGYPHVFLIDFGHEICIESYNDDGEWNVGVDHPLNLEAF